MFNKKAAINIVSVLVVFLALFFAFNFTVNFVFADTLVLNATNGNLYILNEDTAFTFNVSVNVTGSPVNANVTQVNITLPAGFLFITDTNATQVGYSQGAILVHSFTSTTSVLSWTNTTTSGLTIVSGLNFTNFIFNVTASTPGSYNLSVLTYNSTGATQTNLTLTVQDITLPRVITFGNSAEADESNVSRNNIVINVTGVDNGFLKNISLFIYNDTDLVNSTNLTVSCSNCNDTSFLYNFTGLRDGNYTFFGNVTDSYGNINRSISRKIRLDTGIPNIDFGALSETNAGNLSRLNAMYNSTSSEATVSNYAGTGVRNMTIVIYNATAEVNRAVSGTGNLTFRLDQVANFTNLRDGVYTINATVKDYAENKNVTTRTVTSSSP